jgi:cytochrome oxidase Cu insertion factor (SCO1/SenC/PrrC family)
LIDVVASAMAENSSTGQTRSRRVGLFAVVFAVFIGTASFLSSRITSYAAKDNYLPNISLTDQNSQSVSLSSLRGKPVLVGFIHTMCKGVCQMMTANMRSVVSALPPSKAAGVIMLLITTDPADDKPPDLLQYARNQDLSGKEWIMVTGPVDRIRRVMRLYGVKHEETDDAMMHVMKLFLVGPGGRLAHVYPGMKLSPQAVASDIESVSQHKSTTSQSPKSQ